MKQLREFPTPELQADTVYVTIHEELHAESLTSDGDRIRLKNLVEEAKEKVEEACDEDTADRLLAQLDEIQNYERELVTHRGGLVIYITPDDMYYYHLSIPTTNLVSVGDSPNLKALIENFQYMNEFHLLVLNGDQIRLFKSDLMSIEEIELDEDAPTRLEDVVDTDYDGSTLNHGSFGSRGTGGQQQTFHGHEEVSREKRDEKRLFYDEADTYIYNKYSKEKELPVLLFGSAENINIFRSVSENGYLMDEEIDKAPGDMPLNEIEKIAIQKDIEIIKKQQDELFEKFRETSPEYRIDNRLDDLANAALMGRIEALIVKKGLRIDGAISEEGYYEENEEDFVKDLVHTTLEADGEVYIIPDDEMPPNIDLSARLRY